MASELQIDLPKLHEWIHREVIKSGHGSLDEGHWPTATEGQRAAAIEHLGSRRLLIRFSQPDRAALIKEYDGQVKTLKIAKGSKEPRPCWLPRAIKPLSSLSARNSLPRVRGGTESSRTITPSQYELRISSNCYSDPWF